ncbi:phosphoglycerate dehydrogenase [Evansella halocellulosilytica]|uniref:phosphoglycerate dehydrogenase n=1 Tax=Evansella halocellulosilytica TaxID=2011013 RepID=UPI000BB764E2|nr:phosphoglycerate dehydrogenase [Evansella halocellulosilytica]
MKVLVTSPSFGKFNPAIFQELESRGIEVVRSIPFNKSDLNDIDGWIVGLESVGKEELDLAKRLKIVAKHGVGVDNIDLDYAKKRGIVCTNTPGTNNDAVADMAFGLMLSTARMIPQAYQTMNTGEWQRYDGRSVWGKTLGIIGLGAIGKSVARRGKGFSMNVLGYDVSDRSEEEKKIGVTRSSLDEIWESADYISLHAPLIDSTKHMINRDVLRKMKKSAILINTARGPLIKEEDLYEALVDGEIAGCGLDVFEKEPLSQTSPLRGLDNVVITPHIAAYTIEAGALVSEKAAHNMISYLLDGKTINPV